jgi:hypothetical protein
LKRIFHIDFANISNMYFYCMIDMDGLARNTWDINVFIIQIDYIEISCKKDVHICRIKFIKKWNKTHMKQLRSSFYLVLLLK